jgi:hypothetical protein
MPKRIFTVIHSHRHGTSHYVFAMDLPSAEAGEGFPGDWLPDLELVIQELEIDFEPEKEEWVEIECQGALDDLKVTKKDTPLRPKDDKKQP